MTRSHIPNRHSVRTAFIAGVVAWVATARPAPGQTVQRCRPADNSSARLIVELKAWMSATDPERVADRDTLYKIPVVNTSQITLVTDEAMCLKAANAYGAQPGSSTPTRVYLIKLGSKGYAAYDPDQPAGEFRVVMILTTEFAVSGGWTG